MLPIHSALYSGAPLEVIRLLLDNDTQNKSIFEMDSEGGLSIHIACEWRRSVEVVQMLLDSDPESKTIHAISREG